MPQEIGPSFKLTLVHNYFDNDLGIRFPKLLKRLKSEEDVAYEARVKNYLLCLSDEKFAETSKLIDSSDARQEKFLELYTEVAEQRDAKTTQANCRLF